ncbi:hypothetical protein EcB7A_0800 [Escherichia coli B7A]|nr:hypothetical protein EcB7A_0800 [Escherichia coli B7A]
MPLLVLLGQPQEMLMLLLLNQTLYTLLSNKYISPNTLLNIMIV